MVKAEQKKKIAKIIKVNADKCNGCRVCEMFSKSRSLWGSSSSRPSQLLG